MRKAVQKRERKPTRRVFRNIEDDRSRGCMFTGVIDGVGGAGGAGGTLLDGRRTIVTLPFGRRGSVKARCCSAAATALLACRV